MVVSRFAITVTSAVPGLTARAYPAGEMLNTAEFLDRQVASVSVNSAACTVARNVVVSPTRKILVPGVTSIEIRLGAMVSELHAAAKPTTQISALNGFAIAHPQCDR